MATLEEVVRIVGTLKMVYPNFGSKLSDFEWEQLPGVWQRLLADIPFDLLDMAAMHYCSTSRSPFPPSVAELRDYALSLVTADEPGAEEAWGEVMRLVRRYGSYGKFNTETMTYNLPDFSSERISKCVSIMGWLNLCMSENPGVDRAQFMKMYDSLKKRDTDRALALPEVREVKQLIAETARALKLKAGG